MEKMRVLVANDPRVYREVIADGLKELRPLIEVSTAEPDELEREVARLRPHLIICSRSISTATQARCLAWVVLYPDGEDRADVGGARGRTSLLVGVGVNDLLWVVDETEQRWRSSHKDKPRSAWTLRPRSGVGQTGSKLPRRTL